MSKTKIDGMKELERTIRQMQQLPQKMVTKAAKSGAQIALSDARKNSPVDTGNLKRGIILFGEKSRIKGKKAYQIVFDRNMNGIFAKISKSGKRAYYPASQEYGFFSKTGRYIPGYHFLRNSIDKNEKTIERKMIDVMTNELDKLR